MSITPPHPAQSVPPEPDGHASDTARGGLQPGMLGVAAIVFFVVAAVAPMAAIVGASPIVFSANGVAAPATYLLAALLFVVFAVGYVAMSRHITNAGGFVAYIAAGFGTRLATAARLAILTYTALHAALWSQFSVFAHELADKFGLDVPAGYGCSPRLHWSPGSPCVVSMSASRSSASWCRSRSPPSSSWT